MGKTELPIHKHDLDELRVRAECGDRGAMRELLDIVWEAIHAPDTCGQETWLQNPLPLDA